MAAAKHSPSRYHALSCTVTLHTYCWQPQGTLNLIAAAKQRGIKRFVLVTSIGADDLLNPLNLFWGVLFWKKRAEEELQRSGLTYTIVRPGGLKSKLREVGVGRGSTSMVACANVGPAVLPVGTKATGHATCALETVQLGPPWQGPTVAEASDVST